MTKRCTRNNNNNINSADSLMDVTKHEKGVEIFPFQEHVQLLAAAKVKRT